MTNKIHSDVIMIGDKQEVYNRMAKWSYTQIENVDVDVSEISYFEPRKTLCHE